MRRTLMKALLDLVLVYLEIYSKDFNTEVYKRWYPRRSPDYSTNLSTWLEYPVLNSTHCNQGTSCDTQLLKQFRNLRIFSRIPTGILIINGPHCVSQVVIKHTKHIDSRSYRLQHYVITVCISVAWQKSSKNEFSAVLLRMVILLLTSSYCEIETSWT
jgi:hypothetical protein